MNILPNIADYYLFLFVQESMYPCMHTSMYKFGLSEPGSLSYYDYGHGHVLNDHEPAIDEYDRHLETSTPMTSERTGDSHSQWDGNSSSNMNANHVECKFRVPFSDEFPTSAVCDANMPVT